MLLGKRQGREYAIGGGPQLLCCLSMGALGTGAQGRKHLPSSSTGALPAGKLPDRRACHSFFFLFFCVGEVSSGGWPEKILHRKVRVWENTGPGFAVKPGKAGL